MIDEPTQELVIQYLLGELGPAEALDLRARLDMEREIRKFADEIQETLGSLALSSEALEPPTDLPELILRQERPERKIVEHRFRPILIFPWALAACLAIACLLLSFERTERQKRIAQLKADLVQTNRQLEVASQKNDDAEKALVALERKTHLSDMKIAMLKAQVASYEQAVAFVVWDRTNCTGIIQLDRLPPPGAGKDYQLWVIDSRSAQPISAGILAVQNDGLIHANFRTDEMIKSVGGFAISVEKSGGSNVPQGQIVLMGN
jgi:anti-sigma-K factor RskA